MKNREIQRKGKRSNMEQTERQKDRTGKKEKKTTQNGKMER